MNPSEWPGGLAYVAVFVAAVLEGEVVFVTASVLVSLGRLDPLGVFFAGALGGSTGDQVWFYLLRGRLGWLDRLPRLARQHAAVTARVKAHETAMLLATRFLPGLRIAIPAACAYANVRPLKFSLLNLASGFAWAGTIMAAVAWLGPDMARSLGLKGWWGALVPAALVVLFFRWLGRPPADS